MAQFKVLVIDNDKESRESLVRDQLEGYQVFEAASPEQALDILNEHLIHLVIVDIRLRNDDDPNDKSGLRLCENIGPLVSKIILTGFPNDWQLVRNSLRSRDRGYPLADGFLSKDEEPDVVAAEIRRALGERFPMIPQRRIAVLTSGGDSPGMNSAIWSIVRTAMANNIEVIGVQDGYEGLVADQMYKLSWNFVSDISVLGGTILGTARMPKFTDPNIRKEAVQNILRKHITGLIVIGGDGSMNGARALAEDLKGIGKALQTVAIPGTIDNDLWGTDMTLGAASAANGMIEELRNMIRPAQALRRIFVVEAMGRFSGYLSLQASLGIGADAVLIPEEIIEVSLPTNVTSQQKWENHININSTTDRLRSRLKEVAYTLEKAFAAGKRYGFVVMAEGIRLLTNQLNKEYVQQFLYDEIKRWPPSIRADVRAQDLGYMVRGVPPCRFDIWLGARLGAAAVQCLLDPTKNALMVGWSEDQGIIETEFQTVVEKSNRSPKEVWVDRPKWQDLLDLQRTVACPPDPDLQNRFKTAGNRFM